MASFGILVLERVVGVRVGGDDGLELAFAQRRRVLFDQNLEQTLFPDAAGVVSRRSVRLRTECRNPARPSGTPPLSARVISTQRRAVGGVIADEPQVFHRLLARILDLRRQRLGPAGPRPLRLAKGVAVASQVGQRILQELVHAAFVDQVAAHVDDRVEVLDQHRALLRRRPGRWCRPRAPRRAIRLRPARQPPRAFPAIRAAARVIVCSRPRAGSPSAAWG